MKMYLVLWRGQHDEQWYMDGMFADEATAHAKLAFEQLSHPTWHHTTVEIDVPDIQQVPQQ